MPALGGMAIDLVGDSEFNGFYFGRVDTAWFKFGCATMNILRVANN